MSFWIEGKRCAYKRVPVIRILGVALFAGWVLHAGESRQAPVPVTPNDSRIARFETELPFFPCTTAPVFPIRSNMPCCTIVRASPSAAR